MAQPPPKCPRSGSSGRYHARPADTTRPQPAGTKAAVDQLRWRLQPPLGSSLAVMLLPGRDRRNGKKRPRDLATAATDECRQGLSESTMTKPRGPGFAPEPDPDGRLSQNEMIKCTAHHHSPWSAALERRQRGGSVASCNPPPKPATTE